MCDVSQDIRGKGEQLRITKNISWVTDPTLFPVSILAYMPMTFSHYEPSSGIKADSVVTFLSGVAKRRSL